MNPNDAPQEHPVHPAGSPSREHAAEAGSPSAAAKNLDARLESLRVIVSESRGWAPAVRNEAVKLINDTLSALAAGESKARRVLRRLAANAGALRAFEPEVRAAIGNTNWEAIAFYVAEADELLAAPAEPELCSHASQEAARPDVEEEASAPQAVPLPVAPKRWPFVETPGEFAARLQEALAEWGAVLPAVRCVLIENPPTLSHPAGQIAEAPTVSGPASSSLPTVSHEVWAERVACSRVAEEFMREHPPGDHWYSANVISARILGRTSGHRILPPALCERLPEASGSDVKEPAAEPSSAPKEKP